ncbi:MAG: diacylglycerol kinase family protein [Balneolaceae bacterium]
MTKIGAVINSESGTLSPPEADKRIEEIKRHLESRVSPGCLAIVSGDRVEQEIIRLKKQGIHVLVIGGGDGTVSTGAKHIGDTDIFLAVVGLGTRNNFARDLGIPLEPVKAISLLDRMQVSRIDLGEVNGHLFVNNATIGIYPKIVEKREEKIRKQGWKKWPAHMAAALTVLRWFPRMQLAVEDGEHSVHCVTPFLFVGNNEYEGEGLSEPMRSSLKDGKLWFCMARISGLWPLVRMAWHLSVRGIQGTDNLEAHLVTGVTVYSRRRHITIAVDGENRVLATPLHFKIRKKSLQVIVP